MIVSFPSEAGSKTTNTNLFFRAWAVCFSGPVFLSGGRQARFPGRSLDGKPARGKKAASGPCGVGRQGGFALCGLFFFAGGICFLSGRRQARSVEKGHLFFRAWAVCFPGPFIFSEAGGPAFLAGARTGN